MRYIDAEALKEQFINTNANGINLAIDRYALKCIEDAPSIDLADYVPKDFHDKTCEEMAKRHQEEIANMVSVVRCRECKHRAYCYGDVLWTNKRQTVDIHKTVDFCSYGERREP